MRWMLLLSMVLCSSGVLAEVVINEVMYAPTENWGGSNNEWVELYNSGNESINLSGCLFYGDSLKGEMESYGLVIIARDVDKFKEVYGDNFLVLEHGFSSGLNNGGEEIKLSGCGNSFEYNDDLGAKSNGKSLELNKDKEWKESLKEGGTPGEQNSIYDVSYDYSVLEITELLPSPVSGDDEQKPLGEWIEIYNAGQDSVDIKDLVFYDDNPSHWLKIRQTNVFEGTVVESGKYKAVYVNGHYNFNLKSPDDEIKLYSRRLEEGGFLIDKFDYFSAPEGMSWSKIGEEWFLTAPTPGEENNYSEKCDWKIEIVMNNSIFLTNKLDFKVVVERKYGFEQNLTVRGVIEDIFGKEVKSYKPWTNERVVESYKEVNSYSPNGLGEETYMIKFEILGLTCDEADRSDNKITRAIAINPQYKETESTVEVETLYLGNDLTAEWGDQFTAKVNVYKGSESRYSVQVWAEKNGEKISKTTKLNIYDEYKNYPLTVPIQLEPNCHEKISEGAAQVVVSAFDLRAERDFMIEGVDDEVCRDYLSYVRELEREDSKKERAEAYQILDLPNSIKVGEVLRVKVQLEGDSMNHDYKAWSYLYRGAKCYSCGAGERESNIVEFDLGKDEVKQVEMLVVADEEMSEGEYQLKVKLNKDAQKTNKELTHKVYVQEKVEVSEGELSAATLAAAGERPQGIDFAAVSKKEGVLDLITGVVVYESSSERAYKLIPLFIIIVLGLVAVVLIWKRV